MLTETEKITVDGYVWYAKELDNLDGNLVAIKLYDADKEFVCEFGDYKEMLHFLKGAVRV